MISPISIATRGRISPTASFTLTLAVIGWLMVTAVPPTPSVDTEQRLRGGGAKYDYYKKLQEREDEEILLIIKMWVQCQE